MKHFAIPPLKNHLRATIRGPHFAFYSDETASYRHETASYRHETASYRRETAFFLSLCDLCIVKHPVCLCDKPAPHMRE